MKTTFTAGPRGPAATVDLGTGTRKRPAYGKLVPARPWVPRSVEKVPNRYDLSGPVYQVELGRQIGGGSTPVFLCFPVDAAADEAAWDAVVAAEAIRAAEAADREEKCRAHDLVKERNAALLYAWDARFSAETRAKIDEAVRPAYTAWKADRAAAEAAEAAARAAEPIATPEAHVPFWDVTVNVPGTVRCPLTGLAAPCQVRNLPNGSLHLSPDEWGYREGFTYSVVASSDPAAFEAVYAASRHLKALAGEARLTLKAVEAALEAARKECESGFRTEWDALNPRPELEPLPPLPWE